MKIVIRSPNWLGDIVMALPFFTAVAQLFPKADVYVLIPRAYHELTQFFFPLILRTVGTIDSTIKNWHVLPIDRKEIKRPEKFVHFCEEHPELWGADYYFALPPSFSAAFMGAYIGAKRRVGVGMREGRQLWLNHIVDVKNEKRGPIHRSSEFLQLLQDYQLCELSLNQWKENWWHNFQVSKIKQHVNLIKSFQQYSPYIIINCNSEASSRRLSYQSWKKLIAKFSGKTFIFIGTMTEKEHVENLVQSLNKNNHFINLAGKTTITDLICLLAQAQMVISNDSGPAHLASALQVPTLVFFGAGNPKKTAPNLGEYFQVFHRNLSCAPCLKNLCPLKTVECLQGDEIIEACFQMAQQITER